jgi:hypothetical protein
MNAGVPTSGLGRRRDNIREIDHRFPEAQLALRPGTDIEEIIDDPQSLL